MNPKELQDLLNELDSTPRWQNLQEIRWVVKDTVGIELSPPARKTIDLEGRIVKDGVKKALRDRQLALTELVHAIREVSEIGRVKTTHVTGDFSFLGNAFSGFQGSLCFVARIRPRISVSRIK